MKDLQTREQERDNRIASADTLYHKNCNDSLEVLERAKKAYEEKCAFYLKQKELMIEVAHREFEKHKQMISSHADKKQVQDKKVDKEQKKKQKEELKIQKEQKKEEKKAAKEQKKQEKEKTKKLKTATTGELLLMRRREAQQSLGIAAGTPITQEQKQQLEEKLKQERLARDPDWIAACAEWDCTPDTIPTGDLDLVKESYETILHNKQVDKDEEEAKNITSVFDAVEDFNQEEEDQEEQEEAIPFTPPAPPQPAPAPQPPKVLPLPVVVNDTKLQSFHKPVDTKQDMQFPPPPKPKKPALNPKFRKAQGVPGGLKYAIPYNDD